MFRLADGMRDYGYETIAVLPDDKGIAEWYADAGIETRYQFSEPVRARRSLFSQLRFVLLALLAAVRLAITIRHEGVDIVHVNEVAYPQGLLGARLGGAKTICHVRSSYESRVVRTLFGGVVDGLSHAVICVSDRTRERLFDDTGIETEKAVMIRDGVPSPERFSSPPETNAFRDQVGVDEDAFLIVMVSKLTAPKGHLRLVAAAERLDGEYDDLEVAIVGGTVEGHEAYAARLEAAEASVESVQLVGFYPDIVEAFFAADVVVHAPLHEDPFPGVVLEGMLAGKPVVAARTGGIPEQIEDGETGLLVDPENVSEQLAAAIDRLYEDADLRTRLGERAGVCVRERFPVRDHFEAVVTVYEQVYGRHDDGTFGIFEEHDETLTSSAAGRN
jgi:glycosyltransferase involved in cell wall biosynthesis